LFKKLFPQFMPQIIKYEKLFNNINKLIITKYRKELKGKKDEKPEQTNDINSNLLSNLMINNETDYTKETINAIVDLLMKKFESEKINIFDYNSVSIIEDYTIDLSNLDLISSVLFS